MKQLFIKLCLIVSLFTTACNQGGKEKEAVTTSQETKTDTLTANTGKQDATCEYYITEDDGKKMIRGFDNYLSLVGSTPNHKLSQEFWIDKCVILKLKTFFQNQPETWDGVRFYFVGEDKSDIIMTPTFKHKDSWGNVIDISDCPTASKYLNKTTKDSADGVEAFGVSFRKQDEGGGHASARLDQVTISVWYDRCVIFALADLFSTPGNNLNGIMAYSASHLKFEANRVKIGQKYANQNTLIFVPTSGDQHTPEWGIVRPPKDFDREAYETRNGAFNHGQLCPQICD